MRFFPGVIVGILLTDFAIGRLPRSIQAALCRIGQKIVTSDLCPMRPSKEGFGSFRIADIQ